MKLVPLNKHIVVQKSANNDVTKGGIVLPRSTTENTVKAVVKYKADDVELVRVGEKILHGKYAGTEFTVNDDKFLLLKEEDIIAKMEDDD